MIKTVYVLHLNGTPVLQVDLEKPKDDGMGSFLDLFGGFSSAINTLIGELGHKEIKSITVGDGVLVYSSSEPLLFVVHTTDTKQEIFGRVLVKQIEHEFLKTFSDIIDDERAFVDSDRFTLFSATIRNVYYSLRKLHTDYPHILEFLPSFIPLGRLYEVLNLGLDIIDGFPEDTIKLVRKLHKYFSKEEGLEEIIARTLGRYSGNRIARIRFEKEFVIGHRNVLELLNEISVVKLDTKDEVYDIVLCPVCRGRTSENPICHFFSGFIEGAIDNPSISVDQVSCRAQGDKSCRFKLIRS
ncbi:MAG: V4R domain-containing protein [Candidatus Thorarchaeota archaeon]